MNKKISTLFASSLLMMGAVFSTANAQEAKDVEFTKDLGSYYYIAPAGTGAPTSYLIADEVEVAASKAKHTSLKAVAALPTGDDADLALFKISKVDAVGVSANPYFKLTNKKTGASVQFLVGSNGTVSMVSTADAKDATYTDLLTYPTVNGDKKYIVTSAAGLDFTPLHGGKTENIQGMVLAGTSLSFTGTASAFRFLGVSTVDISAAALNARLKNGFVFNATGIEAKDNIFAAQTIKAFTVNAAIDVISAGAGYTIPAGTYFATQYPKELAPTNRTTIDDADFFKQCTFIAMDPATNLKADKDAQKAGKNFAIKQISGDNFNFYTVAAGTAGYNGEKISQGTQVSVYNAAFTVQTNKDNENSYAVKVANFRFKADATKAAHTQAAVYVGNVDKVLTTVADAAFPFTLGAAPVVKPTTLLNDSTASIYNIRFISGIDATTEKGKYLTVGALKPVAPATAAVYSFLAQGSAMVTLTNPQYQFVISDVNAAKNTVTFKNRETAEEFTCELFTTGQDNQYYVAEATAGGATAQFNVGNINAKGLIDYATPAKSFAGTTIELTVATVDKLAGFANRDENAGYTFIKFALDNVSNDNLFAEVSDSDDDNIPDIKQATPSDARASLFELVKSDKPDIAIRNNYQYLKDGVAAEKIKGDTIAYYTYAIKYINPSSTKTLYLKDNLSLEELNNATNAAQFIIKENKDGSVSVLKATDVTGSFGATLAALASTNAGTIEFSANAYMINDKSIAANDNIIKLFLAPEELGASLEAKSQHVAFQSVTGGYLSMNAANEGVVAVKTAADEDLTFWVDSADTQATLPSFFISKGVKGATERMYMYYAKDSAEYYINDKHYSFNDDQYKMIFKAATLLNSDTLATTVNGKAVNISTEADNNGTLGGLMNFKYQIFKEKGADDYVIRCKGTNEYLTSINGVLTQTGTIADAIRVLAEPQSAPTSNDAINAATFSVIAGEGQLTIANAAGKKVVVSNILGQIVANTVVNSDNAIVAAPAGVVVVAVEGEAAVKAIVK